MAEKNFQLEHTKPLFKENKLLTLHHLYIYHTFCDILKLLKYRISMPLFQLFNCSSSKTNLQLIVPKIKLDIAKHNFVFQATCIWNSLNKKVFNQCVLLNKDGVAIPGSTFGSDITTPVAFVKNKLRDVLFETQNLNPLNSDEWSPANYYNAHYTA